MTFYRPHARVSFETVGPSMTRQEFKEECDIHNILKQYQRTGVLEHIARIRPSFEDLPSDVDFQAAMNTIIQAENAFEALPSAVRAHFGNDPATFLAAFNDDSQLAFLREHGLVEAIHAPAATPVAPPASEGPVGASN